MSNSAKIKPSRFVTGIHTLAALNHRQWAQWQEFVLPHLSTGTPDQAGFQQILPKQAEATIQVVRRAAGSFAYEPSLKLIMGHKQAQFDHWCRYAADNADIMLEHWQRLARSSFLLLTPAEQHSAYALALEDFQIVAQAGGVSLPANLPAVEPRTKFQNHTTQLIHGVGQHGYYLVSEEPWSYVCVACNATVNVSHP